MRAALLFAAALAAVAGLACTAVAWYYTTLLQRMALRVSREPPRRNLLVAAIDEGMVALRAIDGPEPDLEAPGIAGLEWNGGRARLGPPAGMREGAVVRSIEPLKGPLPTPGEMGRIDWFVYGDDPAEAHGIPFAEVALATPLGPAPAWQVEGASHTWCIAVHGKGAGRGEALRMLPALVDAGLPVLVPCYRNDPGAPDSADRHYRYGETEWPDLEAAVEHALGQGAEHLVLVGFSMGAGVSLAFLQHSSLAARVIALVFDSPLLSLREVVEHRARDRGMPAFLTPLGRAVASARFGIDWQATDYRAFARTLDLPMLLFHGAADQLVPVAFSDDLASARPATVRLSRLAGVRHVRSWNADPEAYRRAVVEFLRPFA